MPLLTQALGNADKLARGFLGQGLARLARLEVFRVRAGALELFAQLPVDQILEAEFVNLLHRVDPVGVDADAVDVGHDQQRWILQCDRVLQELREGLVFPSEAALAQDIGPAFTAGSLGRALFERTPPLWDRRRWNQERPARRKDH